jgi:sugar diacid utilization regulator
MSRAEEPESWLEDLLSGREELQEGAVSRAERQGYAPSRQYAVAFVSPRRASDVSASRQIEALASLSETLRGTTAVRHGRPVAARYEEGLAVLLPQGSEGTLLGALESAWGLACGLGAARPLLQVAESLEEAQLAATASALVNEGAPTYFARLGPLRLLLLLHRDRPDQLARFVQETIEPLLRHDKGASTPLLPTVRAFVEHGGRLRETAEHLAVHRNTLAYRLQKAEEILGFDLKQAGVRLSVELALLSLPLTNDATRFRNL